MSGMFSSPKKTPVPNPKALTSQQMQASTQAQHAQNLGNAANQVTPTGSVTYTQDPKTGQLTAVSQLSPAQQQLLAGQQQTGAAANAAALTDVGGAPLDLSNTSVMNQIASTYQPQFQQNQQWAQEQLNSSLANQGIHPGSEAYDRAQQDFQTSQSNSWNNILENARAQSVSEMEAQSQIPIQEAQTLAGLGVPAGVNPLSTPQAGVQTPNVLGAQSLATGVQQQNIAQQNQYNQAMLGGLAGLGSAAITAGGTAMKAAPMVMMA